MGKLYKKIFCILYFLLIILILNVKGFSDQNNKPKKNQTQTEKKLVRITFIELGSVKCIPCRMMQPILAEIEQEYKGQVKVVFYDVWTAKGRPYGQKYKIRIIPTQIFLDKDGKEYFRHEGFFPKEEIVKILKKQGVK